MASYNETIVSISLPAAAGIVDSTPPPNFGSGEQYHFVKVTSAGTADLSGAAPGDVVGVLQNIPQVTGAAATVAISGVTLVEAGGTVAAGASVMPDSASKAVATTGTNIGVGVALNGGASGELIPVLIRYVRGAIA